MRLEDLRIELGKCDEYYGDAIRWHLDVFPWFVWSDIYGYMKVAIQRDIDLEIMHAHLWFCKSPGLSLPLISVPYKNKKYK